MATTQPGWYPDNQDPRRLRYWDGTAWTAHVRPRDVASTYAGPYGPPSYAASPRRRPGVGGLIALAVVLAVLGLGAIGAGLAAVSSDDGRTDGTASRDRKVRTGKPDQTKPDNNKPDKNKPDKNKPDKNKPAHRTPRTALVARVVDGDTVLLGNGTYVRLLGMDTPEVGTCGADRATANLVRLVEGRQVELVRGPVDQDRYDRLLRYLDVGTMDAGLRLVKNGLAIARYDSRDGYGPHPREARYIAAEKASPNFHCAPAPKPQPLTSNGGCGGYSPCIPAYPPDLDCADVNGPIRVTGSDPHALDGDHDGVACE